MVIPLIGVSTYVADAAWGSWHRPAAVLPESYYELVGSAGGRPLLLPPLKTAPTGPGFGAAEVIAALDGLVLTGGGDVDPVSYGETPRADVGGVDPVRDGSEQALLAAALAVDMPVLAICRGLQILNVARGGTLHQHLPDVVGHDGHRHAPSVFGEVKVTTTPDSATAAIFGAGITVLVLPPPVDRSARDRVDPDGVRRRRGHRGGGAPGPPVRPRGAVASRGGRRSPTLCRAGGGGPGPSRHAHGG